MKYLKDEIITYVKDVEDQVRLHALFGWVIANPEEVSRKELQKYSHDFLLTIGIQRNKHKYKKQILLEKRFYRNQKNLNQYLWEKYSGKKPFPASPWRTVILFIGSTLALVVLYVLEMQLINPSPWWEIKNLVLLGIFSLVNFGLVLFILISLSSRVAKKTKHLLKEYVRVSHRLLQEPTDKKVKKLKSELNIILQELAYLNNQYTEQVIYKYFSQKVLVPDELYHLWKMSTHESKC